MSVVKKFPDTLQGTIAGKKKEFAYQSFFTKSVRTLRKCRLCSEKYLLWKIGALLSPFSLQSYYIMTQRLCCPWHFAKSFFVQLYFPQVWTNFFLGARNFDRAFLLACAIGDTQKMDTQNQSARPIETQLEKYIFVLNCRISTYSFYFQCVSIKTFSSEPFVVYMLF